jgi:hypothetical protein
MSMVDTNPLSEVVNADWQFEVGRTYVLGPELFDQKLTGNELRLLLILRYRASGGRNNFVKIATLAEDMKVHEQTVKKWMGKLKKLKYVTCEGRGFGRPKLKTITSMVERYDKDVLLAPKKELLGSGRSEETLARLHNLDKAVEDPLVAVGLPVKDGVNLDSGNKTHESPYDYFVGSPTATSEVAPELLQEVDEVKVDQNELDSLKAGKQPTAESPSSPVQIGFTKGEAYDLSTGEVLKEEKPKAFVSDVRENKGETAGTPDSGSYDDADGATRLNAAAAIVATAGASADRKSREVLAKRRAKKDAEEASGEAEVRRRIRREMKAATKKQTQTVKSQIEEHMRNTYRDWFPDAKMGRFTGKEYGQLNSLIEIYDGDVEFIKKAWTFLCEGWDELKVKMKIDSPVPTVSLFVGFRESIFSQIQETTTSRQESEKKKLSGQFEW